MGLGSSITLTHDATDEDFFSQKVNAQGTTYYLEGSTLSEPNNLQIRHETVQAKGGIPVDRHNTKMTKAERDSSTGVINTLSIDITVSVPRTGQFTEAEVERLIGLSTDLWLGDSRLARILAGES